MLCLFIFFFFPVPLKSQFFIVFIFLRNYDNAYSRLPLIRLFFHILTTLRQRKKTQDKIGRGPCHNLLATGLGCCHQIVILPKKIRNTSLYFEKIDYEHRPDNRITVEQHVYQCRLQKLCDATLYLPCFSPTNYRHSQLYFWACAPALSLMH